MKYSKVIFLMVEKGQKINVKKLSDGTTVIKKKIKLVDKGGLSSEDKKCLSSRVQNAMTKDLNCQIGAPGSSDTVKVSPMASPLCSKGKVFNNSSLAFERKCPSSPNRPRTPGVKFEVELEFVPEDSISNDSDVINMHQCYRSEIPNVEKEGDCEEVRKYNVQACMESRGSGFGKCARVSSSEQNFQVKLKECCNKNVARRMETGELFRQNAANMTPEGSRGVWYHEILHTMGLDDEYPDGTYPMTVLGDLRSIMRETESNDAIIQSRHVDRILRG